MKPSAWTFLACLLLAAGCGPPEFVNPLSSPVGAKADPRLEGTWIMDSQGDKVPLRFKAKSDGWTEIESYENEKWTLGFRFFTTTLGEQTYMNVVQLKANSQEAQPNYLLFAYRLLDDGGLELRMVNEDFIASMIHEGKLEGTVAGNPRDILVSTPTEGLVRFFQSVDPKQLLGEPMLLPAQKAESAP